MILALTAVAYLVGLATLAAAVLYLRDHLARRSTSPEEQRAKRDAWLAALLAPRWDELREQLGREAPAALKAGYANHQLVTTLDQVFTDPASGRAWDVDAFQPLDAEALRRRAADSPRPDAVCFATTYTGDEYWAVLETEDADAAVDLYSFDGDPTERVSSSLAAFLAWPRRRGPASFEPPAA